MKSGVSRTEGPEQLRGHTDLGAQMGAELLESCCCEILHPQRLCSGTEEQGKSGTAPSACRAGFVSANQSQIWESNFQ